MMPSGRLAVVLALVWLFPCVLYARTGAPAGDHPSGQGQFDGPAELPRLQVRSSLADSPAPGRIRIVKESDNLQDAIDDAKCGDTLKLQAGASFHGLFRFPKKSCDDSHWIIVRTSAPDNSLPPEGTRVTPCYAGVASLPGRPDYHCSSPQQVLAKIEFDGKGENGPIMLLDGANHYRFLGLEITRVASELHMRNLLQLKEKNDTGNHLIFDRLWLHGTSHDETKGGIHLSGMANAAIVDSYLSDFHCIAAKGSCTDAQAINGGTGDTTDGPYKIENNFLEASGQSILLGGAGGSTTPADIVIRRNHLFKPLVWMKEQPDFIPAYTGNAFIVKNSFELKNAQRVLFEDNVLENSWGGFSQTGFAIVLTPANQGSHCPQCRDTDITIRYNKILNVGSGILIGNIRGKGQVVPSAAGERYSIHDIVVNKIRGKEFKGFGLFALIATDTPPLKDVRFDHITAFPSRGILTVINRGEKLSGLTITNSIFTAGDREIGSAGGGPENCAKPRDDAATTLAACFTNVVVTNNLIIDAAGHWPDHNYLVKSFEAAGILQKETPAGTEYHVCRERGDVPGCSKVSVALRSGNDGKNLGADVEAINAGTAGVQ